MIWNLVDNIHPSSPGRAFFPPLASLAPGMTSTMAVDRTAWSIERAQTDDLAGARTTDVSLVVTATPPSQGFSDESGLPDPLIRLHAMGAGELRFKAATGTAGASLELKLSAFLGAAVNPRGMGMPAWWDRWTEAACIPDTVVYEHVDQAHLQTLLDAVVAPANAGDPTPPTYGLSFPQQVTAATKAAFIASFMAADPTAFMVADPGACIGRADVDAGSTAAPPPRKVVLHARYQDHTDSTPSPLSPLELLYLLFGEASAESQAHPFLGRINDTGALLALDTTINTTQSPSNWMLMRPPLRTFERLRWEFNLEIARGGKTNWGPGHPVGPARLFNRCDKNGRQFDNAAYTSAWKCNLFVCDFAVRSGFRVGVLPLGGGQLLHYNSPNSLANLVHNASGAADRVAINGMAFSSWPGSAGDQATTWCWKIENLLRQQGVNAASLINKLVLNEGRCLVLALAAPRMFNNPGPMTAQVCVVCQPQESSGHMMVVSAASTTVATVFRTSAGAGLKSIRVNYLAAGTAGLKAGASSYIVRDNNTDNAYVRMHLFELHPGKDPDTIHGLNDLNIAAFANPAPKIAEFAAPDTPIVKDSLGNDINPPTQCCHDNIATATPTAAPTVELLP